MKIDPHTSAAAFTRGGRLHDAFPPFGRHPIETPALPPRDDAVRQRAVAIGWHGTPASSRKTSEALDVYAVCMCAACRREARDKTNRRPCNRLNRRKCGLSAYYIVAAVRSKNAIPTTRRDCRCKKMWTADSSRTLHSPVTVQCLPHCIARQKSNDASLKQRALPRLTTMKSRIIKG